MTPATIEAQTVTLASAGAKLIENGYRIVPIEPGTKRPNLPGWPSIKATSETLDRWKAEGRGDWGIGILGEETPGVDLDISDKGVLDNVLAWCRENIGVENTRVGRAPRTLFACWTGKPFGKMSSRKFQSPDGTTHQIEILGKGSQYVAYATHPDTGKPYAWDGMEPLAMPAELLPTLTPEKAQALIKFFESQVPETWVPITKASTKAASEHEGNPQKTAALHRVRSAVEAIPNNDLVYDDWIKVMLALWAAVGENKTDGFEIFDQWSAKSAKYDFDETVRVWETARADRSGAGTLFYHAKQNGWVEPPEDMSAYMDEVAGLPPEPQPVNDNTSPTARHPDPVDLWGKFEPPTLPRGLLPAVIESFAFDESRIMGADPAGLALSALCVCAAAIPDQIKIQVKEHHSGWVESARLWVVLVGQPSSKKSPILRAAARPLRDIDNKLVQQYILQKEQFDKLSKEDKKTARPPRQPRTLIEDVTVEAAIDVLKDNPGGVLCYQDELSSWLGAMDKYAGGRGSQKDRGIWLQAYNGGPYSTNRISRGAAYIPNLSVTLLGGVQPDAIRKVAAEGVDDGLIQRFLPILLRPAEIGTDDADTPAAKSYLTAVRNLREISGALDETPETEETVTLSPTMLRFSPEAQGVRKKMEAYLHEMQILEDMSPKLAAHLGKFDGVFARLCVVWHCLENNEKAVLPPIVQEETAKRVFAFITDFLLRHSIAFYMSTLDFTEHTDVVLACAGHILAHPEKKEISARDFRRGDKLMGSLPTNADRERTLEKLEFLGWVTAVASRTPRDAARWEVNPEVHRRFAKRAEKEASRRQEIRKLLAEMREEVA